MSLTLVLDTEDERAFNDLRAAYLEACHPVGFLVLDEMVAAKWRQRRVWSTEIAAIDFELAIQADEEYECALDLDGTTRARAMHEDSEDLPNYGRYETRFHRMYHRGLTQLLEIQDRRKTGKPVVTPAVPDPLPHEPASKLQNELEPLPRPPPSPSCPVSPRPKIMDYALADAVTAVLSEAIPVPAPPPQNVHLLRKAAA